MGNKNQNYLQDLSSHITVNHFEFDTIIGRGAFSKVWKVILKKYNVYFALKEMSKKKIIDRKSENLIIYERDLLSKINHPFISNLKFSFQDEDKLYLVMDLLSGGDLRFHLYKQKVFTEQQTKFYIACVILALEYLHKNKIIHHDIKPENLLLDDKGYVRLTDFGIARLYREKNADDMSGSPGYIAPEILIEENHSYCADYFSLGIVVYEFMKGTRPYKGKTRRELKENILSNEIHLTKNDIPDNWSEASADFVNQLLKLDQKCRLGYKGVEEIKGHPWLKYYNWKDLYLEKIKAPFIPSDNIQENYNVKYCNIVEKIGINTQERYMKISKLQNYSIKFNKFAYFNRYASELKGKKDCLKFSNPHFIYELLEEKERCAFNPEKQVDNRNNNNNNKHSRNGGGVYFQKRAVSMENGSRYKGVEASSGNLNYNKINYEQEIMKDVKDDKEDVLRNKKHRKKIKSFVNANYVRNSKNC